MKFKFTPKNENQTPNFGQGKPEVKIISLGGTTGVTKNMTVYECGDTIIAVDCGIGFPDSEMLGVDVVLPDTTYLKQRLDKFKGIFISHGHDDHIGAIPYVIKDLKVPVYSTKLVQGLLQVKLRERDMLEGISLKLVDPDNPQSITVGPFTIDYFRVNHSVPEACGISIKTPQGTVFHCPDFKFDWTPVLDRPFDVAKMTRLAQGGVDVLLSDCLGSTTEGYSRSEKHIEDTFDDLLDRAAGSQVFVTTISSNVSRMAQAISSAQKHGRKVVLSGRSIEQVVEVSRKLGYIKSDPLTFVAREKARKFKQSELMYIVAGAYGQPESAISRISKGEHRDVDLEEGAWVIFSADPNPPGVRDQVDALIDRLTLQNAIVLYSEIQENLHVSGHGLKGDLILMATLSGAKSFVPIGGTVKHMRAYANMITELGVDRKKIFEILEGDTLVLRGGVVTKGEKVNVSNVFVDGTVVGDVGQKVIEDRNMLATDGIVVVVVPTNSDGSLGKIDIVTRGFVYVRESKSLIDDAANVIKGAYGGGEVKDKVQLKGNLEKSLAKFFYKKTGREPMVIVSIVGN